MDKTATLATAPTDYVSLSGGLNADSGTPLSVNGDNQINFTVSGTHSGVTVEPYLKTPGGTWVPVGVVDALANVNIPSGAITVATNATAQWTARFPAGMFIDAKLVLTAIASGAVAAEITSGRATSPGAVLVPYASAAQSFAAGISFTGATTVNSVTIPDNLADAYNIKEGSNSYIKCVTTDSAETVEIGKVITADAGVVGPVANEIVTATNVILASESGKTFFLNSATEFVSTLPAPAAGLRFTFICTAAPSGASYTIVTNGSANIIKGAQNSVAGDAGDFGTSDDTISFVDGQAVAGDKVEVWSDGTSWFAYAISKVAAGITFTTAS